MSPVFKAIDSFVDSTTMYRLLLYYLAGLLTVAVGLSLFGDLHYNALSIILSTAVLLAACWATNKVFSYVFDAPTNFESSLLTALILALIITPDLTKFSITFLLAASGLAMASKYILTIRKKHIFNPAAVAVALTALGPKQSASWWVGTAVMLPFVIAGGVLVIRKIRRVTMFASFLASTTLATVVYSTLSHVEVATNLHSMLLNSAVFFLGFVMLTEPLTSPPTVKKQAWYAVIVGALVPPQAHFLRFYASPELALLAGNVFSYIVSPKVKLFPALKRKARVAANTADFVFDPGAKFRFEPGQHMEWTLPHSKADSRGNRRYFTMASSPTEADLRIGVKFYENGSSFKEALLDMEQSAKIVATQIAGDFVLPKDTTQRVAFLAGGIGVTPFRSMVKYLLDTGAARPVTLLYSARTQADLAYKDVFEEARQKIGVKTVYTVTDETASVTGTYDRQGPITAQLIRSEVPDYLNAVFYISGTHQMVMAMRGILAELGVPRTHVKTDFFPGYV